MGKDKNKPDFMAQGSGKSKGNGTNKSSKPNKPKPHSSAKVSIKDLQWHKPTTTEEKKRSKMQTKSQQKPKPNPSSSTGMSVTASNANSVAKLTNKKGLSALQMKFAKKLEGSRFRSINEQLYTTSGAEAFSEFQNNPENFEIYHVGFRVSKEQ